MASHLARGFNLVSPFDLEIELNRAETQEAQRTAGCSLQWSIPNPAGWGRRR